MKKIRKIRILDLCVVLPYTSERIHTLWSGFVRGMGMEVRWGPWAKPQYRGFRDVLQIIL